MVPLSWIYIHRDGTMIDLGRMKNCLDCSNLTLMLNTGKEGSAGKLLATAKVEIKSLAPPKKCLLLLPPSPPRFSFQSCPLFNCLHLPEFRSNLLPSWSVTAPCYGALLPTITVDSLKSPASFPPHTVFFSSSSFF